MYAIDFIAARKIIKAGNMLNNVRNEDLSQHSITSSQSETLLFYFSNTGKSITDLKNHMQISHQAARKLVERLRLKKYLYLTASETDARMAKVFLTPMGTELCAKLIINGHHAGAGLLEGFSVKEKKLLISFLERIEENITSKKLLP